MVKIPRAEQGYIGLYRAGTRERGNSRRLEQRINE